MSSFHDKQIKYKLIPYIVLLIFGLLLVHIVFRQYYFSYFDTYEYMYLVKNIAEGQPVRFYDKSYFFFLHALKLVLGASDYFILKFTHIFFGFCILASIVFFGRSKNFSWAILIVLINTVIFWRLGLSLRENPYFFCFICFQGLLLKYPNRKEVFLLGALLVPGIFSGHVLAGVFSFGFFLLWIIRYNWVTFSRDFRQYYILPLVISTIFSAPLLIGTFNGVQNQAAYGQESNFIDTYGFFGLREGIYITLDGNKNNSISSGELVLLGYAFLNISKGVLFYSLAPTFFVFILGYIPFLGFVQNRVIIYLISVFALTATHFRKKTPTHNFFIYFFILVYGISNMSGLLLSGYNPINDENIRDTKIFLASLGPEDKVVCGRASCRAIIFLDPSMHSRILDLFDGIERRNFNKLDGLITGTVDFDNQELISSEEDFNRINHALTTGAMTGVNKGIFFRDDSAFHKMEISIIDPKKEKFLYTNK